MGHLGSHLGRSADDPHSHQRPDVLDQHPPVHLPHQHLVGGGRLELAEGQNLWGRRGQFGGSPTSLVSLRHEALGSPPVAVWGAGARRGTGSCWERLGRRDQARLHGGLAGHPTWPRLEASECTERRVGWRGGSPCSHLVGPQLHPPQLLSMLRQESHDGGEGLRVAEPFPLHQLVEVGLFWGGGEQGRDPVSDAASEQARFEGGLPWLQAKPTRDSSSRGNPPTDPGRPH